eukprot:GFUD01005971.1.p1 GENE.GFUD01005971.1~~GFUD01005971.1.p1  ORF type:complete len:109 (+),score=33.31 GFUD01005971.1:63-389(+)
MGKGPKHNNAKPRSNGIFKVAGTNFKNDKKGKAKGVTSNLKLISQKNSSKVVELDQTLLELQKASVIAGKSLGGEKTKVVQLEGERRKVESVKEEDMEDLVESLSSKT